MSRSWPRDTTPRAEEEEARKPEQPCRGKGSALRTRAKKYLNTAPMRQGKCDPNPQPKRSKVVFGYDKSATTFAQERTRVMDHSPAELLGAKSQHDLKQVKSREVGGE